MRRTSAPPKAKRFHRSLCSSGGEEKGALFFFALARGAPRDLFHRPRVREEHERGRRKGDSGASRNKKRQSERGAKVRSSDCGGSCERRERPLKPFLSLLSRAHVVIIILPPQQAYLVLGLGSQPLEERVALKGAGCARLVVMSHRFFFVVFQNSPARFLFRRWCLEKEEEAKGGFSLLLLLLLLSCCRLRRVGMRAYLSRDARARGWLFPFPRLKANAEKKESQEKRIFDFRNNFAFHTNTKKTRSSLSFSFSLPPSLSHPRP